MRYISVIFFAVYFNVIPVFASDTGGEFTIKTLIKHFPVIDQGSTGTCWSFATTSFLESEIIRKGYPETDLSEMFFVYHTYKNRALRYLLFHGNTGFSQGGQAHDVMDVLRVYGLVTQETFPGVEENGRYNHRNLSAELHSEVSRLNKNRDGFSKDELLSLEQILDRHLGKIPNKVDIGTSEYSPVEVRNKLELNPDDYIELTSYSHHPFYKPFVLEIPDNWAHGQYYNLPVDELVEVMYHALENGYTVCWDGDTSEKTFSHDNGKADLPRKLKGKVDQALRQETFYNRSTTDDHLMHVVGISTDGKGEKLFYIKNSWGANSNDYGGYLQIGRASCRERV